MKSRTNQYHGSAFDYAVNEALNAYNPGTHTRNKIRRHEWGGTIGGPFASERSTTAPTRASSFSRGTGWIKPKLPDRTAAATPQCRHPRIAPETSAVPSLSGGRNLTVGTGASARDYKDPLGNSIAAGTLFDPNSTTQVTCNTSVSPDCGANGSLIYNRTPLVGNRIPSTMFDPVAQAILTKYIPEPTGPRSGEVANNFYVPFNSQRLTILPSIKLDHNFSQSTRASFLYQLTRTTAPITTLGGAEGLQQHHHHGTRYVRIAEPIRAESRSHDHTHDAISPWGRLGAV